MYSDMREKKIIVKLGTDTYSKYQPREKVYQVNDSKISGFFLYIYPSGTKIYAMRKRLMGVGSAPFIKIGNVNEITEKEARAKCIENITLINKGIDPREERNRLVAEEKKDSLTYRELESMYIEYRELAPNTIKNFKDTIGKHLPDIYSKKVGKITTAEIENKVRELRRADKRTTALHLIKYIHAVLEYGVVVKEILEVNVCTRAKKQFKWTKPPKVQKHIPVNELDNFMTAFLKLSPYDFQSPSSQFEEFMPDSYDFQVKRYPNMKLLSHTMRDYILFLLVTGSRKTEASNLKWKDVDFRNHEITYPLTKSGRVFTFPMTHTTYNMMKFRDENKVSDYVFPNAYNTGRIIDSRRALTKISRQSNIGAVTPHDLRRTFATYTKELGLDIADTNILMNHSGRLITENYVQRSKERQRGMLEDLETFIDDNSSQSLGAFKVHWYGADSLHFQPSMIVEQTDKGLPDYY